MPNADSASETAPTFCWLIERGQLEGQRPNIYWTGRSDRSDRPYGDVWTENVNDAKKYPSKAAAQDALDVSYVGKWIGPATARVVEHGWFDNPLPDAVPSDAHLDVFLNKVPYDYTQDSPYSFAKRALQQWASLSLRPSLDTAPDRHSGKLWSIIRRTLSEALDAYDDTTVRMHARLDGLAAALESDVLAMFAGNSKSHLSREKVSDQSVRSSAARPSSEDASEPTFICPSCLKQVYEGAHSCNGDARDAEERAGTATGT